MKSKVVTTIAAVLSLAISLAVMAGLAACGGEKKPAAVAPEVVSGVAMLNVSRTTVPNVVEAVGTVRAVHTAQVAAQMIGNIIAVNVREGDHVRRGQVLVVIDDAQPRAGMERAQAGVNAADHEAAAAEADYTLASATMKRYQNLMDQKAVSPQEFDEVKARLQAATARHEMARAGQAQARAALAQAKTMLDYARVCAPFDGVVTAKRVDPGTLAAPGVPLLTLEAGGRFRLEASVDESNVRYVKLGENVPVTIDALELPPGTGLAGGGRFQGKVVEIVPAADPASRSFTVKVELPADPQLRSGLFGRAYFARGQRESLLVPRTAVVDRGQLQGVYVVGGDQMATLRYVTLGQPQGDQIEILSGLQPGERLVAAPGARELNGKRIQ